MKGNVCLRTWLCGSLPRNIHTSTWPHETTRYFVQQAAYDRLLVGGILPHAAPTHHLFHHLPRLMAPFPAPKIDITQCEHSDAL